MAGKVDLKKINLVALAHELGVDVKGNERVEIRAPKSRPTDGYVYIKRPLGREFFTLRHDGVLFHKRCQLRFRKVGYEPITESMTIYRTDLPSLSSYKAKIIQAAIGGKVEFNAEESAARTTDEIADEITAMRNKLFQPSKRHLDAMIELLDAKAREGKPIDHNAVIAEFARKYDGEISPNFAEACFDAAMVRAMKGIVKNIRGTWPKGTSLESMKDSVVGHVFARYTFKEKVWVKIGDELKPGWDNSAREKLHVLYDLNKKYIKDLTDDIKFSPIP